MILAIIIVKTRIVLLTEFFLFFEENILKKSEKWTIKAFYLFKAKWIILHRKNFLIVTNLGLLKYICSSNYKFINYGEKWFAAAII